MRDKAPDKIYLQWIGLEGESTWCSDRIHENDIAYVLDTPKHETVEEWEKRTGETYPDDAPCYRFKMGKWHLDLWEDCITDIAHGVKVIVANHHGKPEIKE